MNSWDNDSGDDPWTPSVFGEGIEYDPHSDDNTYRIGGRSGVVVSESDIRASGWDEAGVAASRDYNETFRDSVLTAAKRKWGR